MGDNSQIDLASYVLTVNGTKTLAMSHGQPHLWVCCTTLTQDYAQATTNAKAAGFDGVEVHGRRVVARSAELSAFTRFPSVAANGYLPDQFLQTKSNNVGQGVGRKRGGDGVK